MLKINRINSENPTDTYPWDSVCMGDVLSFSFLFVVGAFLPLLVMAAPAGFLACLLHFSVLLSRLPNI